MFLRYRKAQGRKVFSFNVSDRANVQAASAGYSLRRSGFDSGTNLCENFGEKKAETVLASSQYFCPALSVSINQKIAVSSSYHHGHQKDKVAKSRKVSSKAVLFRKLH